MGEDPKQKARAATKRAQAKYARVKNALDSAGTERRQSFERAREAGLSLAEIGEAAGLHRSRVDQILRGK